jgi:hypothetical protein
MMFVSVVILLTLGLGRSEKGPTPTAQKDADPAAA